MPLIGLKESQDEIHHKYITDPKKATPLMQGIVKLLEIKSQVATKRIREELRKEIDFKSSGIENIDVIVSFKIIHQKKMN